MFRLAVLLLYFGSVDAQPKCALSTEDPTLTYSGQTGDSHGMYDMLLVVPKSFEYVSRKSTYNEEAKIYLFPKNLTLSAIFPFLKPKYNLSKCMPIYQLQTISDVMIDFNDRSLFTINLVLNPNF